MTEPIVEKPGLRDLIQTSLPKDVVKATVDGYKSLHADTAGARRANYVKLANAYYDLATDFYEFGWGQSFHFAPRHSGETLEASLARDEFYIAHALGLRSGMLVLDLGCGVGGPMRAIARFSGAHIVGLNNNAYQIKRGASHNEKAGFSERCSFLKADFMNIPAADKTYDAAYAIESTCYAPEKVTVFREVFRVLKEGAQFAGHDWCLTPRYDGANPRHVALKKDLEEGCGLPDISYGTDVVDALRQAGFELIAARDLAGDSDPETPWWLPLRGDYRSLMGFRRTPLGQWCTHRLVSALETIGLAPKGAAAVSSFLSKGANGLVGLGEIGAFTALFFYHARKPLEIKRAPKRG